MSINNNQQGSVLIFSLAIMSVILAISFSIFAVYLPKIKTIRETANSTSAIYAADSVLEWCIYTVRANAPTPLLPGAIAYLPMDEGSGTITNDFSGNGNNGTLTNGTAWSSGRFNGALLFDGSDDIVNLPNFDITTPGFTIIAWIRAESFPDDPRIISKSTGLFEQNHYFMLSTTNDGSERLRFRLKTNGITSTLIASSAALSVNTWYHVAAVYDGANMILYQDGVPVGSLSKTGAIDQSPAVPVSIGSNPEGYGFFDGLIDDVRIYNWALSPQEILATIPLLPASPVMANGATYNVYYPVSSGTPASCLENTINHRAVGTYNGVTRSLEVGEILGP